MSLGPTGASGSGRLFTVTIGLLLLYLGLAIALLPVADRVGPRWPGFTAPFALGVFVAELVTSFLLVGSFGRSRRPSVLLLAGAFFYSALMALAHVLSFPGALVADQSFLGSRGTVAWIVSGWIAGFAFLSLIAVLLEAGRDGGRPVRSHRVAAAVTFGSIAAAVLLLVGAAATWGDLLPLVGGDGAWTDLNLAAVVLVIEVMLTSIALILLLAGRSPLFLWLCLALAALVFGNALSLVGGGRYTVGWYACRLGWVVSASMLMIYFALEFTRQRRGGGDA